MLLTRENLPQTIADIAALDELLCRADDIALGPATVSLCPLALSASCTAAGMRDSMLSVPGRIVN